MTEEPTTPDFLLGKLTGQVREIIHQINNLQSSMNAIGEKVIRASSIPEEIEKMRHAITDLQANDNKRTGATSLGQWLISSPLIPWAGLAVVAIWVVLGGQK